ncbi:hypothetical protein J6590_057078 [Homalodisca vitripennis]|nr:hypothetical protein J6590_057078 [Homalodisca vitripennis]
MTVACYADPACYDCSGSCLPFSYQLVHLSVISSQTGLPYQQSDKFRLNCRAGFLLSVVLL